MTKYKFNVRRLTTYEKTFVLAMAFCWNWEFGVFVTLGPLSFFAGWVGQYE